MLSFTTQIEGQMYVEAESNDRIFRFQCDDNAPMFTAESLKLVLQNIISIEVVA